MKAHLAYLVYVLKHKWFVFYAGLYLQVPLWQLIIHDLSKFTPAEWPAYVRWFKTGDRSPEAKAAFDAAWEHHWLNNPHHWQYWAGDPPGALLMPMPEKYLREMVADWCGAGRAISGKWDVLAWWRKNEGRVSMHHTTRDRVDRLVAEADQVLR